LKGVLQKNIRICADKTNLCKLMADLREVNAVLMHPNMPMRQYATAVALIDRSD
jgi:hypothetical protein